MTSSSCRSSGPHWTQRPVSFLTHPFSAWSWALSGLRQEESHLEFNVVLNEIHLLPKPAFLNPDFQRLKGNGGSYESRTLKANRSSKGPVVLITLRLLFSPLKWTIITAVNYSRDSYTVRNQRNHCLHELYLSCKAQEIKTLITTWNLLTLQPATCAFFSYFGHVLSHLEHQVSPKK